MWEAAGSDPAAVNSGMRTFFGQIQDRLLLLYVTFLIQIFMHKTRICVSLTVNLDVEV